MYPSLGKKEENGPGFRLKEASAVSSHALSLRELPRPAAAGGHKRGPLKQKFTVSHAVVARSRESRRSQQGHAPPRGSRRGGFPLPRLPVAPGLWPPHSPPPPHTASPLSLRLLLSAVYGTHVSLDLRAPWPIQDDLTQTHFCKTPFFHVRSQHGCRWTWLWGTPPLNPPQPLSLQRRSPSR